MVEVKAKFNGQKSFQSFGPDTVTYIKTEKATWRSVRLEKNSIRPTQWVFLKVLAGKEIQLLHGNFQTKGCGCGPVEQEMAKRDYFLVNQEGKALLIKRKLFRFVANRNDVAIFTQMPSLKKGFGLSIGRVKRHLKSE
ncbi:MAG: hypothetical protein KDC92_02145 [Bacteroidetes bacterium]|nr:hypothetical protein [Bacteroidota bacterium]